MNCSACGGQPQFDEAESGREAVCPLCREPLVLTPAKSGGALSAEEQMAQYEESLKETDWGHQPC
ncbi:MAG: hypothetical protein H8E20_15400 [Verrucomicrobia bacterium]|nr:hypothetical protein [Verrucomicrobiota bacterium]